MKSKAVLEDDVLRTELMLRRLLTNVTSLKAPFRHFVMRLKDEVLNMNILVKAHPELKGILPFFSPQGYTDHREVRRALETLATEVRARALLPILESPFICESWDCTTGTRTFRGCE